MVVVARATVVVVVGARVVVGDVEGVDVDGAGGDVGVDDALVVGLAETVGRATSLATSPSAPAHPAANPAARSRPLCGRGILRP